MIFFSKEICFNSKFQLYCILKEKKTQVNINKFLIHNATKWNQSNTYFKQKKNSIF